MPEPTPDPVPTITLGELLRRLSDDSTPPEDIRPYLIPVPSTSGGIEPGFQPNPSRVTGLDRGLEGGFLIATLNGYARARRHRRYRDLIAAGWTGPRIVSEGDSWFQYPVFLEDIIDHLMKDHAILSHDAAGDTLAAMIQQNEVIRAVEREGASAVLLSAGGNDLFQNGNIANLIESVVAGSTAPDLVGARFDAFLADIIADYRALILRIRSAHPAVLILIHGYAAAFSRMDRWIGRPLKAKGVMPVAVQNRVIEVMLARFNTALKRMVDDPVMGGRVVHVDLTHLARHADDWYDEIHMAADWNAKAAQEFAAVLTARLGSTGGVEAGAVESVATDGDRPVAAVAAHAASLAALDDAVLMAELDRRISLVALDPASGDLPSMELLTVAEGSFDPASAEAMRLIARWERELADILCGKGDDVAGKAIAATIGTGDDALHKALADWIVGGPLGAPPLLAGVVVAILARRCAATTVEQVCAALVR